MRIPEDVIIPLEKLTNYLLVPRPVDDKSKFLAKAGFTLMNPAGLMGDVAVLIDRVGMRSSRSDRW
jgi:hypothetical protein